MPIKEYHIGSMRIQVEYTSTNKEEILRILNIDKAILIDRFNELNKEFSQL